MCALSVPAIALTRGTNGEEVLIPSWGWGTYKVSDDEAERVVCDALEVGYRHIDTAQMYGNEAGVGRAIKASGLARQDLFITSKLNNPNHRREDALRSLDTTMEALDLEVLDLFLVHWPLADSPGIDLVDTWRTMIEILHSGRVRAIGVSNYQPEHLNRIRGGHRRGPGGQPGGAAPVAHAVRIEIRPRAAGRCHRVLVTAGPGQAAHGPEGHRDRGRYRGEPGPGRHPLAPAELAGGHPQVDSP